VRSDNSFKSKDAEIAARLLTSPVSSDLRDMGPEIEMALSAADPAWSLSNPTRGENRFSIDLSVQVDSASQFGRIN
jgi:hypothetical protein